MKTTSRIHVSPTHPVFDGHFPDRPMMPGAMLLDELLRSLAETSGLDPGACEIRSVKFLSPVQPGEVLEIRCEPSDAGPLRFEISVGSRVIATGNLRATRA